MKKSTENDLLSIVASLNILSSNEDLTGEEKEAVYNLYGHTQGVLQDLLDVEEFDGEKLD